MSDRVFMSGNQVLGEAAIRAGVKFFAGYPITPATEALEYLSKRMPEDGRVFRQAESEVAAASMVMGASLGGARAMTVTCGPGLSLMTETLLHIEINRLPSVFVDVQRAGGCVTPEQSDYNFLTKSPGHNGLRGMVYAPSTLQELANVTYMAFDKADTYCVPVFIMIDGMIGQMEEALVLPEAKTSFPKRLFPCFSDKDRGPLSLGGQPLPIWEGYRDCRTLEDALERSRNNYYKMYRQWVDDEVMYDEYMMDDAEYVIIAYGSAARICYDTIRMLRERGIKVGMFRPISVYPFPEKQIASIKAKGVLTVEMAMPPMLFDDVRLHLDRSIRHRSYVRCGGNTIDEAEAAQAMIDLIMEAE